ncbi:hypothetical protein BC567DRAFT_231023 [Phyllosticta citribraziliensis]
MPVSQPSQSPVHSETDGDSDNQPRLPVWACFPTHMPGPVPYRRRCSTQGIRDIHEAWGWAPAPHRTLSAAAHHAMLWPRFSMIQTLQLQPASSPLSHLCLGSNSRTIANRRLLFTLFYRCSSSCCRPNQQSISKHQHLAGTCNACCPTHAV